MYTYTGFQQTGVLYWRYNQIEVYLIFGSDLLLLLLLLVGVPPLQVTTVVISAGLVEVINLLTQLPLSRIEQGKKVNC